MRRRRLTGRPEDAIDAVPEAVFQVLVFGWPALRAEHWGHEHLDLEMAIDDDAGRACWQRWSARVFREAERRGVRRPLWGEREYGPL